MDGIFGSLPPRHVEQANARLELRRDESRVTDRKKDGSQENDYTPVPWEDVAYVSIASLKAFLLGVVTSEHEEIHTPPPQSPVNTASSRAAQAYQTTGRAVHDSNVTETTPGTTHIESNFTEDDVARIRIFIGDLVELERGHITELGLQRSANFLDSLDAAIQAAKALL